MEIKILSPLWGHEHLQYNVFLDKMRAAGYDGFDVWIPDDPTEKHLLFDYLQKHEMYLVAHQHQAAGKDFNDFKKTYVENLYICAEPAPLLINSHTGRDYFSLQQNLELIDLAQEFTERTGIIVAHETHRGRAGYSPQAAAELFANRNDYLITADFSHWTCVTESLLENFDGILQEAIGRSRHIHARIGHEQGPQVADPRAPEWKYVVDKFFDWWDAILDSSHKRGQKIFGITTEFGPKPYMPTIPFTKTPIADQFEINCYIKDMLHKRYHDQSNPSLSFAR